MCSNILEEKTKEVEFQFIVQEMRERKEENSKSGGGSKQSVKKKLKSKIWQ